jgi:hypothetical protein
MADEAADAGKAQTKYVVFRAYPSGVLAKEWTGEAWSRKQAADKASDGARGIFAVCAVSALETFEYGVPSEPPVMLVGTGNADSLPMVGHQAPDVSVTPTPAFAPPDGDRAPVPAQPDREEASAAVAAAFEPPPLIADEAGEALNEDEAAEGEVVPLVE